jgi:hypothetical protein
MTTARKSRLKTIFGNDTASAVDTFGSGLRPYLPSALATPWHDNRPPAFLTESKYAWSGGTMIATQHYSSPAVPLEVVASPLLHFHHMVASLAASPGSVQERATNWVATGCPAVLCYIKCWDPVAKIYSEPSGLPLGAARPTHLPLDRRYSHHTGRPVRRQRWHYYHSYRTSIRSGCGTPSSYRWRAPEPISESLEWFRTSRRRLYALLPRR